MNKYELLGYKKKSVFGGLQNKILSPVFPSDTIFKAKAHIQRKFP